MPWTEQKMIFSALVCYLYYLWLINWELLQSANYFINNVNDFFMLVVSVVSHSMLPYNTLWSEASKNGALYSHGREIIYHLQKCMSKEESCSWSKKVSLTVMLFVFLLLTLYLQVWPELSESETSLRLHCICT